MPIIENIPFRVIFDYTWGITCRVRRFCPLTINMSPSEEAIQHEVLLVGNLSIIPSLLEIICRTTGMGFAAVAKVTPERWIACGVRDEINFGLLPGGELKLETTICNEIRDTGKGVIIDEVEKDVDFCQHPTPMMYGFQSYISIPIFLKNGNFFGTLCAIDPKPAQIKNSQTIDLFNLFTDLLSFHISSLTEVEAHRKALTVSNVQIRNYKDELHQYQFLSHHTLQEPLRKIRIYSDRLLTSSIQLQPEIMGAAQKLNHFAADLSEIIHDITDFTNLDLSDSQFRSVALEDAFASAEQAFRSTIPGRKVEMRHDLGNAVFAIPSLLVQLFKVLMQNSLDSHSNDAPLIVSFRSNLLPPEQAYLYAVAAAEKVYCEMRVEGGQLEIRSENQEKIFEMSSKISAQGERKGVYTSLALARKIVRLLGGSIITYTNGAHGGYYSVILPVE
jgi:signal transduction histidine kinase